MSNVCVTVTRRKMEAVVRLSVSGYKTVAEARVALLAYLREDGPEGDGAGTVESVSADADGINVDMDTCGFGIADADIARAIRADGREVTC